MQRIFTVLYSLFTCLLIMNSLNATSPENNQNVKNDLRILDLLPHLYSPLAVNPGVPEDFVALSPNGSLDPYSFIYWGPENVLKSYFKDPSSLEVPLIRVKLSSSVVQKGLYSFDKDFMESFDKMKAEDPKGFALIETKWGDYPVVAIRTRDNCQINFIAWVGLNDRQTGSTLLFNLVYPDKKGRPNIEDRELWKSLISGTTQLQDGDFFKAYGQDLQDGYTLVNVAGAKLKMTAEKRQSDGRLQVVAFPENPNVTFHYCDMEESGMGAKWKYGEPMVKVYGTIMLKDENFDSATNHVTSVFYKTVPEFTFKKDSEKELLIFEKNCGEIE